MPDAALKRVEEMIAQGADIIDVGGESTRPGFAPLSALEEIERIAPVIEKIKAAFDIPVSLDTYKSQTAQAGIAAGADMINDIHGLCQDAAMANVIAKSGLPCALVHSRDLTASTHFWAELQDDMRYIIQAARQAGIADTKIMLDPGVGFGKTHTQNLQILYGLGTLQSLGAALLLGASRKSVIGLALDLPVQERLEGTIVTTVFAVLSGCAFVRVHDIKENVRAIHMAEAIKDMASCAKLQSATDAVRQKEETYAK